MAPLNQEEKDALVSRVTQELSGTPYACSSLTQLTNGTTNFVFRGELVKPIPADNGESGSGSGSTATTVIIKHSTEFAAANKDFLIDASRAVCVFFHSFTPLWSASRIAYKGGLINISLSIVVL